MISERQLSRGFQQFWHEVTPLLNPHFVALFNEAYKQEIARPDGTKTPAVSAHGVTERSIVAEYSFQVVKIAHRQSVPLSEAFSCENLLSEAEQIALMLIREYESADLSSRSELTETERAEAVLLVRNYDDFLSNQLGVCNLLIEFNPLIRGSGFLSSCVADLSISETLFEVKTVDRNIAGKDIRQLLVYLALQSGTGTRRWSHAGFFNPRRAIFYKFSIDGVIPLLSGGRLASEVFMEMIEYFGTRDLQLDSRF